ncbi:protein cycle isoform X2 [Plodia interpunctella]|uniref:protein cycle isoform X2 n=1 Tax=Plodia interpunctella TaxID=58824 RepID=UPI002367C09D|nr:protein cycle isoform X2 [Plodia interpunctella]
MAREYARVHEFFLQLHELQPPQYYHHYEMPQTNAHGAGGYEVTVGPGASAVAVPSGSTSGAAVACAPDAGLVGAHQPLQHQYATQEQMVRHHEPRKRKPYSDEYEMSGCESALSAPSLPAASATRKRKSSYATSSAYEDDGEDARSTRTLPDKKQNHSEIEKRRRDKMNTYITELSSMVPMCGAMARKLDKLTVLRMAVQHLRSVRGALSACPLTARPRPAFLSERELNALILHAAHDCFLLVVGCDRGRLLYVSTSVSKMLHYEQSELLGQSLFDILHPKDVAKVKEQLSSSDLSPRERLIDAKTMLPVKADVVAGASRLCPGARRSFFCRIKCRLQPPPDADPAPIKEEADPPTNMRKKHNEKKYCVVQCTGYLKSWAPAEMCEGGRTSEGGEEGEACNLSCLVAVGRALPDLAPAPARPVAAVVPPTRRLQYVSRHATDGKFLFVDQRVTLALGFLPQELLGTSLYEYVSGGELGAVARTHKAALLRREALHTPPYSFRRKDGTHARIQTHFKPFRNPWTKDVECLVANNTTVLDSMDTSEEPEAHASYDMFRQKTDTEVQRLIDSQVESHKIGSAIAEEALRCSSSEFSPDLPGDLLQDAVFSQQCDSAQGEQEAAADRSLAFSPSLDSVDLSPELLQDILVEDQSLVDNILGADPCAFGLGQVRNNVSLSSVAHSSPPHHPQAPPNGAAVGTPPPASPPLPPLGLDGNGEAAMAVIMSLLEADAGLGGPVNFSGLPWPLP